jgi:soluble cytochrome b562
MSGGKPGSEKPRKKPVLPDYSPPVTRKGSQSKMADGGQDDKDDLSVVEQEQVGDTTNNIDEHAENSFPKTDKEEILSAIRELSTKVDSVESKVDSVERTFKDWKEGVDERVGVVEEKVKALEDGDKYKDKDITVLQKQVRFLLDKMSKVETELDNTRTQTAAAVNALHELVKANQRKFRENNVRIQGIPVKDKETPRTSVHSILKLAVPWLDIEDISGAVLSEQKDPKKADEKKTGIPNLLVSFKNKAVRDKVYSEGRRNKTKMPGLVVIREDMTKSDMDSWNLAKDQMYNAWRSGGKSKFEKGYLTVGSKRIAVTGAEMLLILRYDPMDLDVPIDWSQDLTMPWD